MKIIFKLFYSILFALGTSCSRDITSDPSPNQQTITTKNIHDLSMNCQGSNISCSGSVGALLIFNKKKLETFCTAFVISESYKHSVLATSSHCLKPEHRNIQRPTASNKDYVYTKYDPSAHNQVLFYDVNKIIYSNHNHTKNLGLDYAYLSTLKRVNVPSYKIYHNSIESSNLSLTVTTANFDKANLLISIQDHKNCSSVADRRQVFKRLIYNSKNFGIQNCRFYHGNSGAPVFFNDHLTGILNSGVVVENPTNDYFQEDIRKAYANNILCTESIKIKKAPHASERQIFNQKWLCSSSFKRFAELSFLIERIGPVDTHDESQNHIDE